MSLLSVSVRGQSSAVALVGELLASGLELPKVAIEQHGGVGKRGGGRGDASLCRR